MDVNPDESGIPGAWTEYVYTNDAGTRFYEINFCLASDSNLMEVILIPYLTTTTGTVAYIYQSDYPAPAGESLATQIMTSTGDTVTALDNPIYSFVYGDVVYVVAGHGDFFKIVTPYDNTTATKSCISTVGDLITAWGMVGGVSVLWGGTGYTLNDVITLEQPANGRSLWLQVSGVSGGVITSVALRTNLADSRSFGAGYVVETIYGVTGGTGNDDAEILIDTIWDDFEVVEPHSYLATSINNVVAHPELNFTGFFITAHRTYHVGAGYNMFDAIFKITYSGTISLVYSTYEKCNIGGSVYLGDYTEDLSGNVILYSYYTALAGFYMERQSLWRFDNPGQATQTITSIYTFPTYDHGIYYELAGNIYDTRILGDHLYFSYDRYGDGHGETGVTPGWYIGKFSNLTSATATVEYINTGLPNYYDPLNVSPWTFKYYSSANGLLTISETEFYLGLVDSNGDYNIFDILYTDGSWTAEATISPLDVTVGSLNALQQNSTTGYFIVGGLYTSGNPPVIKCYTSGWTPLHTYSVPVSSGNVASPSWLSTFATDNMLIGVCGTISDDVWKVYPDGYWEIVADTISDDETAPTMRGAIVNIVSNYTDLGIANDKRIKRVYLDTESQYATCGAFTLEPGYNVNIKVHETGETSEPTGATSLRPFAHPGRQTWDYTNDQFDSTSEAWLSNRIDVGVQGKKFRYSIKVGDVPSANHGILRIRPPMIDVQVKVKGKY